MMKKVVLLLSMALCMVSLIGCTKSDDSIQTYNGQTKSYFESQDENMLDQIIEASNNGEILQSDDDITMNLQESWQEIQSKVGEKIGITSYEISESGNKVTTILKCKFEKRTVALTTTYNSDNIKESITIEIVYSKNEIMKKAALNTVMGIGVVFTMLIFISGLISLFKYIPMIQDKFQSKDIEEIDLGEPIREIVDNDDEMDDLELVAVITAAIAASEGVSSDSFIVRTINRRNNKWQKA